MDDKEILRLDGIVKSFSGNHVLRDIHFSVNAGEVRALVGENGAGKSTMIKIIAGASKPDSGEMFIDGAPVEFSSPGDGLAAGITVIYQELDLLPELTVTENIYLGIELRTKRGLLDKKAMARSVSGQFAEMGLSIDAAAKVGALPIVSQQMVAITKAMVHNARVLIMDEPSSSLTSRELEVLFGQIRRLREKGITVIYISHRLEEIFAICDSVTVLLNGRMVATKPVGEVTREEVIELMIGKKVEEKRLNHREGYDAPVILEAEHLSHGTVLEDVSFAVKRGEIFGVLGLLGSGSIELGKLLYGVRRPSAGVIKIDGEPVALHSPADALKASISYVPDERRAHGVFLELDVEKNAVMSSMQKFLRTPLRLLDKKKVAAGFGG